MEDKDKTIKKLTSMTEKMYTSLTGQMKYGYYAIWNPRFQELKMIMEAMLEDYGHCKRGKILQNHYDELLKCQKRVLELPSEVFEAGNLEAMAYVREEMPKALQEIRDALKIGLEKYDRVEKRIEEFYVYEKGFINASSTLVDDYKHKLQNRIKQNIEKVRQFEGLPEEERRYFMTHVLFFDEGKIENTILEYLNEAEQKVVAEALEIEKDAIVLPNMIEQEESREYVYQYRLENEKSNPKELSISRKILKQGEIENKFETWFNNLLGEDSSVGKLINEGHKIYGRPIEEQMFTAMENVIDGNLGNLKMTEMIEAYKEECIAIREKSFLEFYGDYKEVENLLFIVEKALQIFPEWETRDVSIADIILGEY